MQEVRRNVNQAIANAKKSVTPNASSLEESIPLNHDFHQNRWTDVEMPPEQVHHEPPRVSFSPGTLWKSRCCLPVELPVAGPGVDPGPCGLEEARGPALQQQTPSAIIEMAMPLDCSRLSSVEAVRPFARR
eukprot:700420-Hanusia_phi.AAC.4